MMNLKDLKRDLKTNQEKMKSIALIEKNIILTTEKKEVQTIAIEIHQSGNNKSDKIFFRPQA